VIPPLPPELSDVDEIHVVCCSPTTEAARRRQRPQRDVNSGLEQLIVATEMWTTLVVLSDIERYRQLARRTRVYLYAPSQWDQVGEAFDASPEMNARRLALGAQLARNPVVLQPPQGIDGDQLDRVMATIRAGGDAARALLDVLREQAAISGFAPQGSQHR
jgi:hypothetical protein